MVLEIWAHSTEELSNTFPTNKNKKNINMLNPNIESSVVNNQNQSMDMKQKFERDEEQHPNVSHLSSNGYYGYSNTTNYQSNASEHKIPEKTELMEFEVQNSIKQPCERRKRNFNTNEVSTADENKRFKHEDDIYDNFRQASFDPNATSIEYNQYDVSHGNVSHFDTEMMQPNELEETTTDNCTSNYNTNHINNKVYDYLDTSRCMTSHMM